MTDIVERLRQMADCGLKGWHDPAICEEIRMAADEIERLRQALTPIEPQEAGQRGSGPSMLFY